MSSLARAGNFTWRNPWFSMPVIVLIWGSFYFFSGTVINVNEGLGYTDGLLYGKITGNFYEYVFGNQVSTYSIQRIFPSFVVSSILSMLNLPKDNYFIVKSFQAYNLLLIIFTTFIWNKIAKVSDFNLTHIWTGFVLAFLNFGIAELAFFYPVLTDITAFFLGFCLLYFHLKDSLTGKIIITILGAFTWPSFMFFGILLIIFPKNSLDKDFNFEKLKVNLLSFLVPVPFLVISIHYINNYFNTSAMFPMVSKASELLHQFLYASAVLNYFVMAYFFAIYVPAFSFKGYLQFIKKVLQNVSVRNFIICIIIFSAVYLFKNYFGNDKADGPQSSVKKLMYSISLYSVMKPFNYAVLAISYFGPCFVIYFFYIKKIKEHVLSLGLGVCVSFILVFLLLFTTESRQIMTFFPFIVMITILFFQKIKTDKKFLLLLTVFSLILSKVYIPLKGIPDSNYRIIDFPNQLFLMNSYICSNEGYLVQLAAVLLISAVMIYSVRNYSKILQGPA
ncbi:MAG: hypothetical protein IPL53_10145 [Ignavibacteria bacterium]|nr:hypothetical protein [Ignavibacteria bacterium]